MGKDYAGLLMLLAMFVPAAAIVIGALTLLIPRRGHAGDAVADRRARAHA